MCVCTHMHLQIMEGERIPRECLRLKSLLCKFLALYFFCYEMKANLAPSLSSYY